MTRIECAELTVIYRNVKILSGSPGELSEEFVTLEKRKKSWRMSCDLGEATEGLENGL